MMQNIIANTIMISATLEPLVAKPHSPDNKDLVRNVKGTQLTKCYIGSCTGGKLSDFQFAAKILFGNKVKVPTFVVPASTQVARELEIETFNGIIIKTNFRRCRMYNCPIILCCMFRRT